MFKNYLKVAWRNLLKNKLHAVINISGLAIGMAVALLAAFWIWDELTYDRYFDNHKKLAQVMVYQSSKGRNVTTTSVSVPMGEALRTRYRQDFKYVSLTSWNESYLVGIGDKKIFRNGMWVQGDFPEMFTLKMVAGTRKALNDPSSVLISASMAQALFGSKNALNQTVQVNNTISLKIAGVYEDLPHNTSFYDVHMLLPWTNQHNSQQYQTKWDNHCAQLFVQLANGANLEKTSAKIQKLPTPEITAWYEDILLHPLDKKHLYSEFTNRVASGGPIEFVWLFGTIGVFVLLLACINFMNLSTARSEKRVREVGIRKTMGGVRQQLIAQFLSESVLLAFMSFMLSILLVQILLPFFNQLAGKEISTLWNLPVFWVLALLFALFTGLMAGSYPAFYLSGFNPIRVLKGVFRAGRMASLPRRVLVVLQFTVSVTLVIGTIVVFRQIQFAKDRPVGYNRAGLITMHMHTPEMQTKYEAIRTELLQTGMVENVARSSQSATYFSNNNNLSWREKDPANVVFFRDVVVSPDFGATIGWKIKDGRDFSRDFPGDSASVILNEEGVKVTGFKNPIGEIITYHGERYTVIGVVNDMLTQSPYEPIEPAAFFMKGWTGTMTIRLKQGKPVHQALARVEAVMKQFDPGSPFDYKFVDEEYARKFTDEVRVGKLAGFFAILAILISCMGLFGLASFVAEQRTKEIGVRKVLGASVLQVCHLLTKEFMLLVGISLLIAMPLAWYGMYGWLQDYQYRTTLSWWIFAAAALGAIVITLLTVGFQGVKAGLMNPVKSLRTE
jgi:ABC-type antimicrobial peptide transport system, permease component